ncbi:MAG: CoB--CoM heterodisulfide reductase iron-sulfur subunit B family protein [candidate division WOR-3 bacterium]|nr:CoB--CoM heterodisulfide reductase iron-sulfur subunit B family protein [candidate division WOR-3 bacterium]
MKQLAYYPGCTLYTKSRNLDLCARESALILGIELKELDTWNCCGAIYSTVQDDLANQVAPIRNLIEAQKISNTTDSAKLVTLCAACYNVLKRSNHNLFVPENEIYRKRIMNYLETDYNGKTETVHYLEVLKYDIGFESLKSKVKNNLNSLKVASYYGCLMVRPSDELNFDDPDNPTIMDDMFFALGAVPINYAFKTECCGGYLLVNKPEVAIKCAHQILENIIESGADCVVTTCPLCQYNLDKFQVPHSKLQIPVFYFTQLLGLALGVCEKILNLANHYVDPKPLLKQKGLWP